ncbi:MAG: tRNA (adenosine(37)-N6)-threonylcarbamoyltransferase complex ATPase subunit type 1 TsaE [Verrucomicrobiota bacterium]
MASIISHNPQETFELGKQFAGPLRRGDVLALEGDLGAGKTQFAKGLAAGLGVESDVTSPTFTLIHEYPGGRLPLFHIDLYRLEGEDEVLGIGLDEYLDGDGVTVIEWADKFAALMPKGVRWIRFRVLEGDDREITL